MLDEEGHPRPGAGRRRRAKGGTPAERGEGRGAEAPQDEDDGAQGQAPEQRALVARDPRPGVDDLALARAADAEVAVARDVGVHRALLAPAAQPPLREEPAGVELAAQARLAAQALDRDERVPDLLVAERPAHEAARVDLRAEALAVALRRDADVLLDQPGAQRQRGRPGVDEAPLDDEGPVGAQRDVLDLRQRAHGDDEAGGAVPAGGGAHAAGHRVVADEHGPP